MQSPKPGMWFKDANGDTRVVMTGPDRQGDVYYVTPDPDSWNYTRPSFIQFNWTPLRRARWLVFRALKHRAGFSDHTIRAIYSPDGRKALVLCGCKAWTLENARRHYESREREYLNWEQNRAYNAWALRYLDRLEATMKAVRGEQRIVARLNSQITRQRRAA